MILSNAPSIDSKFEFRKLTFQDGNALTLEVIYSSASVGNHDCLLLFTFKNSAEEEFRIFRILHGQTESADMDIIKPTQPYQRPKKVFPSRDDNVEIIRGTPPNG